MKPTPVIRKEMYLNAMGAGGTIPVPSPYPRIEKYLYRLDGFDDKDIPSPENRTERYLYWLCGYRDKWIDTPVTRIDKYMYYACGYEEYGYPTPVTREEQFWYDYIQAYIEIKTLTGTLPLTFRTSETALRSWTVYGNDFQQEESKSTRLPLSFYTDEDKLRDWTIYGNNTPHNYSAEGTLPLTFTTHTAGAASDWEIEGNNNIGKNIFQIIPSEQVITETGTIHFSSDAVNGVISVSGTGTGSDSSIKQSFTVTREMAGNYYYSADFSTEGSATTYDLYLWDKTINHRIYMWDGVTNSPTIKGTEYQECLLIEGHSIEVSMRIRANVPIENLTFKPMIRPADTSATFEPYQIGVGQRTVNLFNATIEQGGLNSGAEYGSNTRIRTTFMPNMLDAGTYTVNASGVNNVVVNYFDDNKTYTGGVTTWRTLPLTFNISNRCYVRFAFKISDSKNVTPSDISNIMLVEGSTAPANFVPYGYEIPLTINSTPQDIYIGSTPLTAGQSVSKTSTGVDIAAIAGTNTITTDLYNKPSMSIEGVDYVGVGEYVNGQWQIPLTVSDGTNTTTVNIPIDAPLTAYDTATKTSTGVDIATYVGTNTISTTLENKPTMLVYYGYKGVGEHSGDTWELYFITSANGNQQLTKITMDKPLRAGETLTSEQAGVTIPTYADTENTLSLYPSAAGYGNPEMSITYKEG